VRILVAGLTGQLGHGVVEACAGDVELVAVVRPSPRSTGAERARRAFGSTPLAGRTVEGDVTSPLWRLDERTRAELADRVDAVVNVTGQVDWTAPDSALLAVNAHGALNGLLLARDLLRRGGRCRLYCVAGSVYTAGARTGPVPEERHGPDGRRTRYEHSKWVGEELVLERGGEPRVLVARLGGLIGSTSSGATTRRSSLYLLADELTRLPAGLLPSFGAGRADMLPRDQAGALLLRAIGAAVDDRDAPAIVHVCAGEHAPRTDALLELAHSLDAEGRLPHVRRLPLPPAAMRWASENAERWLDLPRERGGALTGMRYLALDRVFERDRLAALVGPEHLPAPGAELIARLAFDLPAPQAHPARGVIARFSR
jgi:thioester reductase-like protein